jgi:RimJ/RimL family protein N-acetyltransferase
MLHIAADPSKRWMNREYLWFVFYFPFVQLGVTKIIAPVESTNEVCSRFVEHIGFTLEATLKDCAPKGDMLIYTMKPDQCRWLNLKDAYRGQRLSTRSA